MTARAPLLVQFVYHPGSAEAEATAEYLHRAVNDDAAVPGLHIPTCFIPDDGTHTPPAAELPPEADRVIVVLLADDHLAANARRPTASTTWADYVVRLRALCNGTAHRFMPVQLTEHAWPIDARLDDMNFLRAWTIEANERQKFIARRLVHLLIQRLRPRPNDEDAPRLTIFLSHTKLDLDHEPRVVKSLLAHLTATQPERTWFDSGDIASGSLFAKEIEHGVAEAALLAVVTDSYSSRSWCRREVLFAKRHQRPVVVVDAVQEREVRSFPYVGNVPVIRWNGNAQDVVDLLLRETLRHAFAEESLNQRKEPDDIILPAGPELVTLVHRDGKQPVLYPDPPLGREELAILDATGVRVETPLERYARRKREDHGGPCVVALSVSEAEDVARFGLRRPHLDAVLVDISRYLLLAGVRLAYGGHLRASGYTTRLVDLLHDPVVEHLRGVPLVGDTPAPELITYIAWPMAITVHDEARLGSLVEVRRCDRPTDVDEQLDAALMALPADEVPADTAARRYAWSRGLTEMRDRQTQETTARVIVGGRLGPTSPGYRGRMPGVLEEALLSIQAEKPVYFVGAFGGCARLVVDALEGASRVELTWDHQHVAAHSDEVRQLYYDRGRQWDEYTDIAALFRARGLAGLKNGLTVEENRELARTRSAERIIELVLSGLKNMSPPENITQ